jgi:predicted O-methyltransferase YrrM
MDMTPQRWTNTCSYLREVFGDQDQHLAKVMPRAIQAGLPDIAVSPDVGRLLKMLMHMSGGLRALEIGTLAGYSSIWIARGLHPCGHLVTIEAVPKHADFAQRSIDEAGLSDRIDIRRGSALDLLPDIAEEFGPGAFDMVFLDAAKQEYPAYFEFTRPLIRVGGLLVADNVLGSTWWIDDPPGKDPSRDAVDRFNRTVAADEDFEVVAVPLRQGILIARRIQNPGAGRKEI